ncbi:MAG: VOC family protein [Melioribacteraceae bacterium]|nr:VOC family protein [Melioribacteraceae bacterium]
MKLITIIVLTVFSITNSLGQNINQKSNDMKLSNIRLLVSDFEKSFTFYNETLRLKCTWGNKDDVFASFDIGLPSGLAIFKAELMADAIGGEKAENDTVSNDKFAIVIEVDNVDKAFKELQNKSIKFITEPKDMKVWGIRVAHFRDPDGNLIEIFSNLPKLE